MFIIKFWGTRGTYTVADKSYSTFGNHTPCISIEKHIKNNIHRIIIDGGTGLIQLGNTESELLTNNHIFLTHYHFDHIEGIPFFQPMYNQNSKNTLYGRKPLNSSLDQFFNQFINPNTFPVSVSGMKSDINFKQVKHSNIIEVGPLQVECFHSSPKNHPHLGSCYYKITDKETNKSIGCLWDYEKSDSDHDIFKFFKDVNILIHDTFFTKEEYVDTSKQFKGYGHANFAQAIENAELCNVKDKLICFHYNIRHNDEILRKIESKLTKNVPFEIKLSQENQNITV